MMSDLLVIVFFKKIRYPSLGMTRHDRTFV
jgi:hypothetical protein